MRRRLTVGRLSLGVALAVAALRLAAPGPLEQLDLKALDFRALVRGAVPATDAVVIVGIDEASLATIGRWPWPRTRLAALVDRLAGASVVGFDIIFDQAETTPDPEALRAAITAAPERPARELLATFDSDARFAEAMRRSGHVVLGYFFELGARPDPALARESVALPELSVRAVGGADLANVATLVTAARAHLPLPVLARAAAGAGHVNVLADADGMRRRVPLVIRVGERAAAALALEMVRRHRDAAVPTLVIGPEGVRGLLVAGEAVPVDGAGQLGINYLGPRGTFRYVSAADVLAGRIPAETFAGRMVLVGFAAAGFDEIATPFAPVLMGAHLQATVIDNLLRHRSLRRPWWAVPAETGMIVVVGLVLGAAFRRLGAWGGALVAAGLALAWLGGTQALFTRAHLVLGVVYPGLAIGAGALAGAVFLSFTEERDKRRIRRAFAQYVSPEIADTLAREPSRLRLGGERREMTVLFSDVRNFAGISEQLDPETLGDFMNGYLDAMTEAVFVHDGLLDKYVGDAVMAFWGAPLRVDDHAARSCRAAVEMLERLATLHERWRADGLPLLEMGVGVNTGVAAVGNFGSSRRFAYTAIGDDVNLASRLEGLNRFYGTRILVAASTRAAVGEEFVCREIDRVRVKGRRQAVTVHEVLGRADGGNGALVVRAEGYAAALAAYRGRAFGEALALAERLATDAGDRAAVALAARCRAFLTTPPPETWEAVTDMITK